MLGMFRSTRRRRRRRRSLPRLPAWMWLLLLLALGGGYALERQQREHHAYAGLPQGGDWQAWQTRHRVLRSEGYMVGFSDLRLNPLWVTYRLHSDAALPVGPRPSRFSEDWRSLFPLSHDDYTGSGYDRGHMAPNYAMARVHGREAQLQSFRMTNITPQRPALNRQAWQRLEQAAMDHFLPLKGELWVITGPIFHSQPLRSPSLPGSRIEIPDAFYKIFIAPARGDRPIKVLAFVMPQTVRGNEPLEQFLVSIRDIERATGLNFLHKLPQDLQEQLETHIQPAPWQLQQINRVIPQHHLKPNTHERGQQPHTPLSQ